jgi:hypothetical protein
VLEPGRHDVIDGTVEDPILNHKCVRRKFYLTYQIKSRMCESKSERMMRKKYEKIVRALRLMSKNKNSLSSILNGQLVD